MSTLNFSPPDYFEVFETSFETWRNARLPRANINVGQHMLLRILTLVGIRRIFALSESDARKGRKADPNT